MDSDINEQRPAIMDTFLTYCGLVTDLRGYVLSVNNAVNEFITMQDFTDLKETLSEIASEFREGVLSVIEAPFPYEKLPSELQADSFAVFNIETAIENAVKFATTFLGEVEGMRDNSNLSRTSAETSRNIAVAALGFLSQNVFSVRTSISRSINMTALKPNVPTDLTTIN